MFVPYPSQRNVVGFINYAGHCRREHLGFVRRAAIVNYGKYCIGKARSKILMMMWEEERIFAVHIGILMTRRCMEFIACTSSVIEA